MEVPSGAAPGTRVIRKRRRGLKPENLQHLLGEPPQLEPGERRQRKPRFSNTSGNNDEDQEDGTWPSSSGRRNKSLGRRLADLLPQFDSVSYGEISDDPKDKSLPIHLLLDVITRAVRRELSQVTSGATQRRRRRRPQQPQPQSQHATSAEGDQRAGGNQTQAREGHQHEEQDQDPADDDDHYNENDDENEADPANENENENVDDQPRDGELTGRDARASDTAPRGSTTRPLNPFSQRGHSPDEPIALHQLFAELVSAAPLLYATVGALCRVRDPPPQGYRPFTSTDPAAVNSFLQEVVSEESFLARENLFFTESVLMGVIAHLYSNHNNRVQSILDTARSLLSANRYRQLMQRAHISVASSTLYRRKGNASAESLEQIKLLLHSLLGPPPTEQQEVEAEREQSSRPQPTQPQLPHHHPPTDPQQQELDRQHAAMEALTREHQRLHAHLDSMLPAVELDLTLPNPHQDRLASSSLPGSSSSSSSPSSSSSSSSNTTSSSNSLLYSYLSSSSLSAVSAEADEADEATISLASSSSSSSSLA